MKVKLLKDVVAGQYSLKKDGVYNLPSAVAEKLVADKAAEPAPVKNVREKPAPEKPTAKA